MRATLTPIVHKAALLGHNNCIKGSQHIACSNFHTGMTNPTPPNFKNCLYNAANSCELLGQKSCKIVTPSMDMYLHHKEFVNIHSQLYQFKAIVVIKDNHFPK